MRFLPICVVVLITSVSMHAAALSMKPAAIFSDHMVLQQGVEIPVWGIASPGEEITVSVQGWESVTTADANGRWLVRLGKLEPGGPMKMLIAGHNMLHVIKDVMVGEVWVGSRDSDARLEIAAKQSTGEFTAIDLPQLRMFLPRMAKGNESNDEIHGEWTVCSPDTVPFFSALGYLFGRNLFTELRVPVGIVMRNVVSFPVRGAIWSDSERSAASEKIGDDLQLTTVVNRLTRAALHDVYGHSNQ